MSTVPGFEQTPIPVNPCSGSVWADAALASEGNGAVDAWPDDPAGGADDEDGWDVGAELVE